MLIHNLAQGAPSEEGRFTIVRDEQEQCMGTWLSSGILSHYEQFFKI